MSVNVIRFPANDVGSMNSSKTRVIRLSIGYPGMNMRRVGGVVSGKTLAGARGELIEIGTIGMLLLS